MATHKPVGAMLPADLPPDTKFAAVAVGGKQFKVTEGDVLIVDRVRDAEVGKTVEWDDVLLVGSQTRTLVGRPRISGAVVTADVEQQTHAAKDVIFKKRRRKGYKKFNTFRRPLTVFRIKEIQCPGMADE